MQQPTPTTLHIDILQQRRSSTSRSRGTVQASDTYRVQALQGKEGQAIAIRGDRRGSRLSRFLRGIERVASEYEFGEVLEIRQVSRSK